MSFSGTPAFGYWFAINTIRSASGTGRGRSNTEFTIAKVAVFTPIASASVSTTVTVNPFDFRNDRVAMWMSLRRASIVRNPSALRLDVSEATPPWITRLRVVEFRSKWGEDAECTVHGAVIRFLFNRIHPLAPLNRRFQPFAAQVRPKTANRSPPLDACGIIRN